MRLSLKKRHLLAFFCICTGLFLAAHPLRAQDNCTNPAPATPLTIKSVIDGDTVITDNNTHIRLIGIDTPEIDYRNGQAEALAYEARDLLQQLIGEGGQVHVRYGVERKDQYGRSLAHLYRADGTNIQLRLLLKGLAFPLTYPPNTRHSDCYYDAADKARARRLGLWGMPDYQPLAASELPPDARGYRVITMKVKDINRSKRSLTICAEANLVIFIPGSSLYLFDNRDINDLIGNQITVQGELFRDKNHHRLLLRYPRQLAMDR